MKSTNFYLFKAEEQHDVSFESGKAATGKDGKEQKNEVKRGGNNHKNDCTHVRAKRGQATNSHSLAERVGFYLKHPSASLLSVSLSPDC